ncbi:unnamed protein product [Phytophthora lilii]|uniref:Unnamed protein product n=1 Tax=Phytophthora lilii TaxID=2077276 RepID=A0A9W6TLS6_9STRA|nr:unnamed protein product [Phytophthora lilii]
MLPLPKIVVGQRKWFLLLLPLIVGYGVLMATIMNAYDGSDRMRDSERAFLRSIVHPVSPFYQRGEQFDVSVTRNRAVLMCMHDGVLAMGVSLVRELRCLGNQELVQVYHCGPKELSEKSKNVLFSIDDRLELVDVCSDLVQRGVITKEMALKFRNWWIKPLAMYHTDVRHVILMDVDDIITRDPATLRGLKPYQTTGTTFFYDRVHSNCGAFVNGKDGGLHYLKKLFATFNYTQFDVVGGNSPSPKALKSFAYTGRACHEMDSSLVLVDKETFWLSFELAHVPYSFSPWGVSVVSSTPNKDMSKHPESLCGSILQYMPVEEEDPEMLYVNGKALLDPYPEGVDFGPKMQKNNMFNTLPTHMAPRLPRTVLHKVNKTGAAGDEKMQAECLVGLGATPLPESFAGNLLRRRLHFLGATAGVFGSLQHCENILLKYN